MVFDKYRVTLFGNIIIAEKMSLETACLLVKALFEQYDQESDLKYTIERMTV